VAAIDLFPRPSLSFERNDRLHRAVQDGVAALGGLGRPAPFSIAIVDLADGSSSAKLGWGAHKPDEVHYIASSAKIAALLAAHGLLDMANRFVAAGQVTKAVVSGLASGVGALAWMGVTPAALGVPDEKRPLFKQLREIMDPAIDAAAPIELEKAQRRFRLPTYEAVLAPPSGKSRFVPGFTAGFRSALREMIVPSSNAHAGICVRGVGYGYLNGMMAAAGLRPGGSGVWLAGDYVGQWPPVRVPSANDGEVAQAGTALTMAKMMAMIVNDGILDKAACGAMRGLLADAVHGIDVPYVTRSDVAAALRIPIDRLTHTKLGYGPLKKGGAVASETFRLQGLRNASKAYVVAYQNAGDAVLIDDVCYVLRHAITAYEG